MQHPTTTRHIAEQLPKVEAGGGQQRVATISVRPFNQLRPSKPSFLAWPMMGSTTARRFNQRLILSVTQRFWPVM
jgi:hypothetical protein